MFPPYILMASHTVETTVSSLSYLDHLLLTSQEVKKYVPLILHVDFRFSEMGDKQEKLGPVCERCELIYINLLDNTLHWTLVNIRIDYIILFIDLFILYFFIRWHT